MTRAGSNNNVSQYDVVIIGGGFAGVFTALELAKHFKVLLLEKGSSIIGSESSSRNECYKLHTGLHYVGDTNGETAKKCLTNSVVFAREFPDSILGKLGDPWRRGRHYIMSNSLYSKEQALQIRKILCETYQQLVDDCPDEDIKIREIFGPPADFIKVLENRSDYSYVAEEIPLVEGMARGVQEEKAKVVLALDSAESQVDIDDITAKLKQKIAEHPNITLKTNQQVTRVSYTSSSLDYQVSTINPASSETQPENQTFRGKAIVNCAWQGIEKIDSTLGMYVPDDRVVRVKVTILVKLPPALHNMNTCIFSVGPFCSITNLGNGTAVITEETITNVGEFKPGSERLKGDLALLLNKRRDPEEKDDERLVQIGRRILSASAKYVPALEHAEILENRIGFVKMLKTNGKAASIYTKDSPIHNRTEDGVESRGFCYMSHSGIKMTYTQENAIKVRKILSAELAKREILLDSITMAYNLVKRELEGEGQIAFKSDLMILKEHIYDIARNVVAKDFHVSFDNHDTDVRLAANEIKELAKQRFLRVKELNSQINKEAIGLFAKKTGCATIKQEVFPCDGSVAIPGVSTRL